MRRVATAPYAALNLRDRNPLHSHDNVASLTPATHTHTHTHTHTRLTALCPGLTTWVSRYQKGKTNLTFTEARDSEWQWHQLGHMQVCTSLQTDNHASAPPLSFSTDRMPFLPPNQRRDSTEGTTSNS